MSIYNYKLKISYVGTRYLGWQIQPDTLKTVQGQLNHILSKISKSTDISTMGSGRTDSGVHALGQIVKANIPLEIDPLKLMKGLNSQLPADIRVTDACLCEEGFHPVRDALWKRYSYYFYVGGVMPPSANQIVTWERARFDEGLFRAALKEFVGTHDFLNFSTKGTLVKSTVRTVYSAELDEVSGFFPYQSEYKGQLYRASFVGNGFLKQMVRLLVGAAFMSSRGKITPDNISAFFQQDTIEKLGPVASADGLYLEHVEYQCPWASSN